MEELLQLPRHQIFMTANCLGNPGAEFSQGFTFVPPLPFGREKMVVKDIDQNPAKLSPVRPKTNDSSPNARMFVRETVYESMLVETPQNFWVHALVNAATPEVRQ